MPVAHRCPKWSGGRSLPDSCCQMGPDTVEWPLALCAALALCVAPSVAVRPQPLLCGPWRCCAAPGVAGRPLVVAGRPLVVAGRPLVVAGRPLVVAGWPLVVAGWPLALLGSPWFCWAVHGTAGQSMVPLGSMDTHGTAAQPGDRCHCSTANLSLVTKSISMCLFLLKY